MMLAPAGDRSDRTGDIAIQSAGFAVAACMCILVGFVCTVATHNAPDAGASLRVEDTVNPNFASPASLARLPGVGPVRAQAIVSHRSQHVQRGGAGPAFRRAEDLEVVPGIGPTTIATVRPWLSFEN